MPKCTIHCGSSCVISGGRRRCKPNQPLLNQSIDQTQEEQIHHPSQSEDLPAGVLLFDEPGQLFPERLNEIDDEQAEQEKIHLFRHHQKQW
jgi:hypothetical protein